MLRILLVFISIAYMHTLCYAQQVQLTVLDENDAAVAFATVTDVDENFISYTDENGQASIDIACATPDYLIIYFGYQTQLTSLPCDENTAVTIKLIPEVFELKTINIIGNNANEQANKPYQVATISRQALTQFQSQSTVDALEQQGGAFIQRSQMGGGSPILRGFEANKVLLVVDGIRLNNAIYRSGHLQNALSVDQSILENISTLYGPGSIVYGSDALGGVMHFQTQRPSFSHSKEVQFKGGYYARYATANEEKAGHVHVNIGGQKLASLTSITYRDFGDLRSGSNYPDDYPDFGKRTLYVNPTTDEIIQNDEVEKQIYSGYSQVDLLQKLTYKINPEKYLGLNFQYSTTSDIPRYDELTVLDDDGLPEKSEWYYGPQMRLLAAVRYDVYMTSDWADRMEVQASYQRIFEDRHQRNYLNPNLRSNYEVVDVYSGQADFLKKFDDRTELSYGAEYRYNLVSSTAELRNKETGAISYDVFTRYPSGMSHMHDAGVYALGQRKWDKWTVQVGGRFNYNRLDVSYSQGSFFDWPAYFYDGITQSNTSTTWLAGANYAASRSTQLRLFTGTAFRAPNVDDFAKVRVRTSRSISIPNPDLSPEKTWNVELGVQQAFFNASDKKTLHIGLTGYYTRLTDAIIRQPFTLPNGASTFEYQGNDLEVQANVNADEGYIYGISSQINAQLSPSLAFNGSVSYQRGRSTRGSAVQPLAHIPPLYGQATIEYTRDKFNCSLKTVFNGKKKAEDFALNSSDNLELATAEGSLSWTIINAYASYSITPATQIRLAGENLLDKHYRTFSSGISAAGRNIKIGVYGKF